LTSDEINFLIDSVYENYEVDENQKSRSKPIRMICLVNELELSKVKLTALAGIQSFFEDDLKMMNRAHNSAEAQNV
jgi:oxygen-independent coproporphyrinogen-3 oxidase